MAIYKAQVSLPRTNGIPADTATNTTHWRRGTTTEDLFVLAVRGALETFYDALNTVDIFSNQVVLNQAKLKIYDLADPEPQVPVFDGTLGYTGANPTGNPLPSEVAVCLSWTGEPMSGVAASRRRGRTFLGPVNTACQQTADRDTLDPTKRDGIAAAGAQLCGPLTSDGEEGLVIYSHTAATAFRVIGGFVDNAFDTQRRRGKKATTRATFVAA